MHDITPSQKNEKDVASTKTEGSYLSLKATDNKIPTRDILWYIFFTVMFLTVSATSIYLRDWALLSFVVVAAGVTLWRGNRGIDIILTVDNKGIKIDSKQFFYNHIENFYFSNIGEHATVTFQPLKKYDPRITLILLEEGSVEAIREKIGDNVPEKEPRDEGFLDFIIRKLKI